MFVVSMSEVSRLASLSSLSKAGWFVSYPLWFGLTHSDCVLPTLDCVLPTLDCVLPTLDCVLPTLDCVLPIALDKD